MLVDTAAQPHEKPLLCLVRFASLRRLPAHESDTGSVRCGNRVVSSSYICICVLVKGIGGIRVSYRIKGYISS